MKKIILGLTLIFSFSFASSVSTEEGALIFKQALERTKSEIGETRTTIALFVYNNIAMVLTKTEVGDVLLCLNEKRVYNKYIRCNQKAMDRFERSIIQIPDRQHRLDLVAFMTFYSYEIMKFLSNAKKRY